MEPLITEVRADLKIAEEITYKLLESYGQNTSDDVRGNFLDVQREWERNMDLFDRMKQDSSSYTSCLKWTFGYLGLGAKYNKWHILHQLVTVTISIFCFFILPHVNNNRTGGYCDYWGYIDYDYIWDTGRGCYWSTVLLPPYYVLKYSCILSLSACIAIGSLDMICVSKTVRKRITRKAQIWFDITMASVLCLTWILVLISCAFSIRLIRHHRARFDVDHLMEKYTLLTMVLSLFVITAQLIAVLIDFIRLIWIKKRQRTILRMVKDETEGWGYARMNNADVEDSSQLCEKTSDHESEQRE
ncbi:uncharacterized protein LOC142338459 isoform X2 [Convolutriloba macropyga]|uniref:uncharacterized protein LOC142338459 isoform X2 n=1 Tax=Convolutriloba macropyga TaxID=536237 RepID=UPI003F51EC2A